MAKQVRRVTARDKAEFAEYLRNCTDAQVQGVYEKEEKAGRKAYARLAVAEANRRGLSVAYAGSLRF